MTAASNGGGAEHETPQQRRAGLLRRGASALEQSARLADAQADRYESEGRSAACATEREAAARARGFAARMRALADKT